jgi:hypothetical protein
MVRVLEVIEQTTDYAVVNLNNGERAEVTFERPIGEYTVLHWNGLTLDEVNAVIAYHNEKGFY